MKDDILCKLYVDTCSDVSNDCESEILEGHSDVPTTSSRKQSRPCPLVFAHDSETNVEEEG
jgi:hypothetical protein